MNSQEAPADHGDRRHRMENNEPSDWYSYEQWQRVQSRFRPGMTYGGYLDTLITRSAADAYSNNRLKELSTIDDQFEFYMTQNLILDEIYTEIDYTSMKGDVEMEALWAARARVIEQVDQAQEEINDTHESVTTKAADAATELDPSQFPGANLYDDTIMTDQPEP